MNFTLSGTRRKRGRGSAASKQAARASAGNAAGDSGTTSSRGERPATIMSAELASSSVVEDAAATSVSTSPASSGLSFFDAAAQRHEQRKKQKGSSDRRSAYGDASDVMPGATASTLAIPLQTSSMFTGAVKYEEDISKRPDEVAVSDRSVFEAMPVEAFGAAMLRGMGWAPGKPVGGSVKAVVEPFIAEVRGGRLGVGAMEAMDAKKEEQNKKKEGNKEKRHRLEQQDALGGEPQAKRARGETPPSWLCSGIRVRVVDEMAGEKWYGKKGVVQEVLPLEGTSEGLMCTVIMDGGENVTLDRVRDDWLSTALPKKGGRVRIVMDQSSTKHGRRGQIGTLMKRNKSAEQATVQLEEDSKILVFSYDEVSENVFS